MTKGKVYLIGAGPGDPDLITLKGKRILQAADCIIYDALVSTALLADTKPGAERIYVGKRAANHAFSQDEINATILRCAEKYALVARLKGGDPYVFGRGGEEALCLADAKIAFEVIPGISSALAGPAYAGIPVTQRGICTQFTVFTGHEMPGKAEPMLDIAGIAKAQGTKVMLMGISKLPEIIDALIAAGQNPTCPAAAIQWAASSRQRKVCAPLNKLANAVKKHKITAPAIIVIGEVVKLNTKLDWHSKLPLIGKRIIVTRSREQASRLSQELRELGADTIELPTIKIVNPSDRLGFAEAVVDTPRYDWLIFSSPNAVKRFFPAFFAVYEDIREIGGARIAAVGPATAAELKKIGLMVDVVPQKAVAEELIAEFDRKSDEFGGVANSSMLWVHSEQGRDFVYKELMKRKAIVDECIAYNTIAETEDPLGSQARIEQEGAELITFTSSSTVKHFMAMGIKLPQNCIVASIGPITTATLAEYGIIPQIIAKKHTVDSLIISIRKYFA